MQRCRQSSQHERNWLWGKRCVFFWFLRKVLIWPIVQKTYGPIIIWEINKTNMKPLEKEIFKMHAAQLFPNDLACWKIVLIFLFPFDNSLFRVQNFSLLWKFFGKLLRLFKFAQTACCSVILSLFGMLKIECWILYRGTIKLIIYSFIIW